jgi:exosome complex protein LRP1
MDTANLLPLLEQLDDDVDDLEDALQPLLGSSLNKMSKNMPIFDKAKIHVLTTYTLESLIFCTLDFRNSHE